jgi:alpha-tubulin suppressor-like RCC1 family protein
VNRVDLAIPVDAIAAGSWHTCAIAGGAVWCWGSDDAGQVDMLHPPSPERTLPVQVPGITGAFQITAGMEHTCATTAEGVVCWGDDRFGQLGDAPSELPTSAPVSALVLRSRRRRRGGPTSITLVRSL